LGYGQLFKWNSGVASRGKLMGKSYEERNATRKEAKAQVTPTVACNNKLQPQQLVNHDIHEVFDETEVQASAVSPARHEEELAMTVCQPLTDPLVHDLDLQSRYYLHHFATQICDVMVVYDVPGGNPIRDLIPATSAYPLLLHVIVANSAFHVFNISRNPIGHSAYQAEQIFNIPSRHQPVLPFDGPLKSSYRDALVAKQQALSLLAQSVAAVHESNIDIILVTILMFVNYALVESGRDKWKTHMDGALELIRLLGEPPYLQTPMSRLRKTILSDFLVFFILGSTFSFTAVPTFFPETIELDPILRYAETNNYLSCPGPLLRIMLESYALPSKISQHVDDSCAEVQAQIESLLRRALDFDPLVWSSDFQPASPFEDIEQRIRIAAAHRSAVCIYLVRVLPTTNPLLDSNSGTALVSLTALANDVVHNISYLKPKDPLFKSICWPLFLAGAESRDPAQREWIMNTLDELYSVMFWGYLHTSKRVLEAIWKYLDSAVDGDSNCWVDEVRDLGNDLLIA
jgi:hypothetical protein